MEPNQRRDELTVMAERYVYPGGRHREAEWRRTKLVSMRFPRPAAAILRVQYRTETRARSQTMMCALLGCVLCVRIVPVRRASGDDGELTNVSLFSFRNLPFQRKNVRLAFGASHRIGDARERPGTPDEKLRADAVTHLWTPRSIVRKNRVGALYALWAA
ncbi:hypothetical protein BBO_08250 [Beauveria brongniartii RCEF 3172]|uniref:Uncharacterized protein n=1 Tax=Beauveria brongniartii RCEF 3172 TaxID=1081107 RepID=A0A166XZN6_9HYPO|nr:hypothetical protein BBO_08250 [Beauveria brongniartii RCEF 3172]